MEEYLERLTETEKKIKTRSMEIESNYEFKIPYYVLSEWVLAETDNSYNNVIALINLALINNRISEKNANILKNDIKSRIGE